MLSGWIPFASKLFLQIMGFDILVKKNGEPILLEVNSAPSLTIDHVIPVPGGHIEVHDPPRVRSIVDEVGRTWTSPMFR